MTALADAFDSAATRRAARAALTAAHPDATVADCQPLGRGNRKETALVTLDGAGDGPDCVVVQAATDAAAVRTERALLDAVAERTSVPVPTVLAAERVDGAAALVTEYVAGADLHEEFTALDADARTTLARQFGRHLAELHDAFAFDGYGPVTVADEGGTLTAAEDDWPAWFESYARAGLGRLPDEFDDLRGDLAALFDGAPAATESPARLFPWDFRPGNALVADGDLVAVLDWEAPLTAPPALSVAKAEYLVADWYVETPAPLRTAFRAGYESVRPFPTVRPAHRAAAVCRTAVDSEGVVTNPRYPELDRAASVSFHRRALERALADADA